MPLGLESVRKFKLEGPLLAILILTSVSIGCTALHITHVPVGSTNRSTAVDGVPFYPKKARCRQEIVWLEPIYTLSLAALVKDKDGALQSYPRGAVALSRSGFQAADVTDFVKLLNNGPSDEPTVLRSWRKVVALSDPHVLSRDFDALPANDRILAGRSTAPLTYVDYLDQYYVNAKVPIAGSANLDAKVADDGSLTEVSGQVENKTLETILSALPISSVISGALGLPAGSKSIATGDVEALQLTITITGYKHTLARLVPYSNPCPVSDDLTLANATEYKREDAAATPGPAADDKASKDSSSGKTPPGSSKPGKKP